MNWNDHFRLEGKHAFLGASKYQWLHDDDDQFLARIKASYSTTIGTILHDIARTYIKHQFKMNRNDKKSVQLTLLEKGIPRSVLNMYDFDRMFDNLAAYVNDAYGFRMDPEVVLYYSDNCFGTADAISFSERDKILRIHDYKSGTNPAHMDQLEVYAALFCHEYKKDPEKITTELAIYQNCEVLTDRPEPEEIRQIMDCMHDRSELVDDITNGVMI